MIAVSVIGRKVNDVFEKNRPPAVWAALTLGRESSRASMDAKKMGL